MTTVIIEVRNGIVEDVVCDDENVNIRVVYLEDFIECPQCGEIDHHAVDHSTHEDYYICNACNHNFKAEEIYFSNVTSSAH